MRRPWTTAEDPRPALLPVLEVGPSVAQVAFRDSVLGIAVLLVAAGGVAAAFAWSDARDRARLRRD